MIWNVLYKDTLNEHISERKVKIRSNSLPWMNSHRKIMNHWFKVLKYVKQTGSKASWEEYRKLRNEVTSVLRIAEANYWKQEFKNANFSKDFWKLVGKLTNKKKQSLIGPIRDDQNNIILDDSIKAEAMNDFFITIGPTLASNINPVEGFSDTMHLYRVSPTLSQVPLERDKLQKRLSTINPIKASGPDLISPRDLHL